MNKILQIFLFSFIGGLCMGMGDPTFLPAPRQPGLINEMQSTTSNLNQIHREPAEKKQLEQESKVKRQETEPLQQLMDPQPGPSPKIK